jgi:hypothetical protein
MLLYKYAIGLQLIAIKQSVAQVLLGNLTLQLHPFAPSHNNVIQRLKQMDRVLLKHIRQISTAQPAGQ